MKEVETISQQLKVGPGTLYGSIKGNLAGLIEKSDDRPDPELDDQRRRYYRLTGLGGSVLEAESRRLAALLSLAKAKHVMT